MFRLPTRKLRNVKLLCALTTTAIVIAILTYHFLYKSSSSAATWVYEYSEQSGDAEAHHLGKRRVLSQDEGTTVGTLPPIVNPHDFEYLINEPDVCSKWRSDLFVLTVVHTAPGNFVRRMHIRQTWGNQELYHEVKTVVLFTMGSTNSSQVQQAIHLESERYHDIIQEDFVDAYKNLTYKAILWLKWTKTYCTNALYVLKVDDDMFVNIFNLVNHLHHLYKHDTAMNNTILCLVWSKMPVMRDPKNKWYVSRDDYADDHFKTYCSGSAYIMTQDLMEPLYAKSLKTKFFWVDDFYVTGLLPRGLNVTYRNIGSLYVLFKKQEEEQSRLVEGYSIFGHINSVKRRYKLWKAIANMRGHINWS